MLLRVSRLPGFFLLEDLHFSPFFFPSEKVSEAVLPSPREARFVSRSAPPLSLGVSPFPRYSLTLFPRILSACSPHRKKPEDSFSSFSRIKLSFLPSETLPFPSSEVFLKLHPLPPSFPPPNPITTYYPQPRPPTTNSTPPSSPTPPLNPPYLFPPAITIPLTFLT